MIIGIEGVSCVGKTALAARLAEDLAPATVVPCYFHSVDDPTALPPLAAATPSEQLAGLELLLDVETTRRARTLDAQAAGRTVILDRTVDTLLAHTAAVSALRRFDIAAQARSAVHRREVAMPDLTFLLAAPYDVRRARAALRSGMASLLYAPDFTRHFTAHFEHPLTPECIRLDATQPLAVLVEQTLRILDARAAATHLPRRGREEPT